MKPEITSPTNPRVKTAVRLRESRTRRKEKRFLIDGVREIVRAARSGVAIKEIYLDPTADSERHHAERIELIADLQSKNVPIWPVAGPAFSKMAFGDRNEGIIALAEEPDRSLHSFENALPNCPLVAVLEGIEKAGNIGAVFRSADGAGIDGVILADCADDFFHPNAIRASLGTLFSLPSVHLSAASTLDWLASRQIRIAAALCGATQNYSDFDFRAPTAIALGSEADGLTPLWPQRAEQGKAAAISLPMLGLADSLNISAAAAVLFYEARRQREQN